MTSSSVLTGSAAREIDFLQRQKMQIAIGLIIFLPLWIIGIIYTGWFTYDYIGLSADHDKTLAILLTVIVLKSAQNITSLIFFFRQKVPEHPEDKFIRFTPKLTKFVYWTTYVVVPVLTMLFLISILVTSKASETPRAI